MNPPATLAPINYEKSYWLEWTSPKYPTGGYQRGYVEAESMVEAIQKIEATGCKVEVAKSYAATW